MLLVDAARIFTPDLAYYDFKSLMSSLMYNDEIMMEKNESTGQIYIKRINNGKKD
jgi:hypothetical protein